MRSALVCNVSIEDADIDVLRRFVGGRWELVGNDSGLPNDETASITRSIGARLLAERDISEPGAMR